MILKRIKNRKKKLLLQNLVLVCTSSFLFLLLLEITLRCFGYGSLVIYQPDLKLFWKPLPNQNCYTKFGHKPVHINSKGTRGPDFDGKKPKNVFRIISLGDSKTFGWGLSEAETYSVLLQDLLQNRMQGSKKIEVINAGVNAWSYAQMYVYLRETAIKYDPDIIILADANLWTQFSEESGKEFRKKFMKRVRLKNLLRRSAIYHFLIEVKLEKIYQKYRTKFIPVDPETDELFSEQQKSKPELFFKEQIVKISELITKDHLKALLTYIPNENSILSSQKPTILKIKEEVSKEYNIPLLDFTRDFSSSSLQLFLPGDPVHPNAEGNKIIANQIFHFIISELDLHNTPAH